MNHCINCGNNIPDEVKTCGEAGFGDGCGNTLSNIPKQPPEGRVSVDSIVEEFMKLYPQILGGHREGRIERTYEHWLRQTLTNERTRHAEEKERLVREIMDLFYCMNFDITIPEQHQLDIEIKAIAAKFNIDVK